MHPACSHTALRHQDVQVHSKVGRFDACAFSIAWALQCSASCVREAASHALLRSSLLDIVPRLSQAQLISTILLPKQKVHFTLYSFQYMR